MRKKVLIAALLAMAMGCTNSVKAADATNITGATLKSGTTNVYETAPDKTSGGIGYSHRENFYLKDGDVLNMIFNGKMSKNGVYEDRPVSTFVNLVDNRVQINGIMNSVNKDGNYTAGHAIFIAPKGFAVGANGVVNVGHLSVTTPTQATYETLLGHYNQEWTTANEEAGTAAIKALNGYLLDSLKGEGNADIQIDGRIIAKDGVKLYAKNATVNGKIVNGAANNEVFTTKDAADTVFNSLVGADGIVAADKFVQNGSEIVIKAKGEGGIVTGENSVIANGGSTAAQGGTFFENNGTQGITLNGKVDDPNWVQVKNNNGDLKLNGKASLESDMVFMENNGNGSIIIAQNTHEEQEGKDKIQNIAAHKIQIQQNGTGEFTAKGDMQASESIVLENKNGSKLDVAGNIKGVGANTVISIVNHNGKTEFNAKVDNTKVYEANNTVRDKRADENGTVALLNYDNAEEFVVGTEANVKNKGVVRFGNAGKGGMDVYGTVENKGDVYIVNQNGKLNFANDAEGYKANVTNEGNIYIAGQNNSVGIYQGKGSIITNKNGHVLVKNESGQEMKLEGQIDNQGIGTIALNNYSGYMDLQGRVNTNGGKLNVVNKGTGMNMNADVTLNGGKGATFYHDGTGNMNMAGKVTYDGGHVNAAANQGMLNLSTVVNSRGITGQDGRFYAVSQYDGQGVDVAKGFTVDGNGQIKIANINGPQGLNYNGSIHSDSVILQNYKQDSDMTLNGTINAKNGRVQMENYGQNTNFGQNVNIQSSTPGYINTETSNITGDRSNVNNVKTIYKDGKVYRVLPNSPQQ